MKKIILIIFLFTNFVFPYCKGGQDFYRVFLGKKSFHKMENTIKDSSLLRPHVKYLNQDNTIFGGKLVLVSQNPNDTIYYIRGFQKYCNPDNHFVPHFNKKYQIYKDPIKIMGKTPIFFYSKNGKQKSIETYCFIHRERNFPKMYNFIGFAGTRNINSYYVYSSNLEKHIAMIEYNSYRFIFNYSITLNSEKDLNLYLGLGIGIYLQAQLGYSIDKDLLFKVASVIPIESDKYLLDLPFGMHLNILYEYSEKYSNLFGVGLGISFKIPNLRK